MSNVLKCVATHTNKPLRSQANCTWISLAGQLALDLASSTANYSSSDWRFLCSTGSMLISRLHTNGQVCKKSNQTPSNSFQYISGSKLWAAIGTLVSSLPRNNKRVLSEAGSGEKWGGQGFWRWSHTRRLRNCENYKFAHIFSNIMLIYDTFFHLT